MMFQDVVAKFGTMRAAQEFTLCPQGGSPEHLLMLQSEKRIAQVNMLTGKVVLSDGKGGHPGFHKLNPLCGAKEYDCPADVLEKLKALKPMVGPVVVLGVLPVQTPKAEFIDYVHDFYGPESILYPMGATRKQITEATDDLIKRGDDVAFDSVDREKIRDILIEKFGLKFPEPQRTPAKVLGLVAAASVLASFA